MSEFQTSLLREKFTITDLAPSKSKKEEPVIALSNRIVVPLISHDGIDNETFIVRTQNMHSCARLAAAITREFFERGTIANRAAPFSWKTLWQDVIKGYEKDWNPDIWCAVYYKGRAVFQEGEHHPFLDIIEQCDANNKKNMQNRSPLPKMPSLRPVKKSKLIMTPTLPLLPPSKMRKPNAALSSAPRQGPPPLTTRQSL